MCTGLLLAILLTEVSAASVEDWTNQVHAQVITESACRPNACSTYACGLAQFTLPTWGDISPLTRPSCEGTDYRDPACSVRSQIVYMRRLLRRYKDVPSNRDRWMFAWAAYNRGPGWVSKEARKCKSIIGCDSRVWIDNVENICLRAKWACIEGKAYPKKVLMAMGRL